MLGDVVYECKGKLVGMRVLPDGKLEDSGIMQGIFLGEEFSGMWTAVAEVRPDGTGYSDIRGFYTTKGGNMGKFMGNGNGIHKPDGSMIYRGGVCYLSPPGKYSRLNGIAVVYEYESDKDGNYQMKGWEWK